MRALNVPVRSFPVYRTDLSPVLSIPTFHEKRAFITANPGDEEKARRGRTEGERCNLQREAWSFSLLFIYSFISAGSLGPPKGQRCDGGMCFLGTRRKKKLQHSAQTGSTGSRFIWTPSLHPNKHFTKIGVFFFPPPRGG